MAESEREIEVRSLAGESTTISISPDKTIQDLKLLLNQTFLPATSSPNFHLFLKGAKLSLQSRISSHSTLSGEFIVLVPFTKKDRLQTQQSNQSATPSRVPDQNSAPNFADSAWSDMMQDLSSIRDISNSENQSNFDTESISFGDRSEVNAETSVTRSIATKRKRGVDGGKWEGPLDEIILSILESPSKNFLDDQICERLTQVLETVNCLLDAHYGDCMLLREANLQNGGVRLHRKSSSSCLCPPWLKIIMKSFVFLNIFSGFLQMRCEEITWTCLKEVLTELGKFGLQVGIDDLEHLSILCPKVVRFADSEMEGTKLGDSLIIINSSTEQRNQVDDNPRSAQKRVSRVKIVSAMKKRDSSFKSNLCRSVKLLMRKNGNDIIDMTMFFSLEDLLTSVKEDSTIAGGNEAKQTRKSRSAASSSHSVQIRCHQGTKPLLPEEMVEHLRKGFGSRGQAIRA